jgi:hypothetical protein
MLNNAYRHSQLIAAHGFRPDALDANRAGVLTPEQASGIGWRSGVQVTLGLAAGVILVVVGCVGIEHWLATQNANGLVAALGIVGGALVAWLTLRFQRRMSADLAERKVAVVEGMIRKTTRTSTDSDGSTSTTYHYRIGRLSFRVRRAGYRLLNARLRYRVYYLPRTRKVVNLEPVGVP